MLAAFYSKENNLQLTPLIILAPSKDFKAILNAQKKQEGCYRDLGTLEQS